jgi:hypothetical protein
VGDEVRFQVFATAAADLRSARTVGNGGVASFVALLVAVSAAGAGCAQPADGRLNPYACVASAAPLPSIDDEGPTLDEICPAVADALCAQWARCACGVSDLEACRAHVSATCAPFVTHADVPDALARGTLGWSGSEARAFLTALGEATVGCEPVDLDLSNLAVGRTPDFEPCTDISGAFTECRDGSACQYRWGLWAGDPPAGFYCAPDDNGHSQRTGRRCSFYVAEPCGNALRCAPVCRTSALEEGVCSELLDDGSSCEWDDDCASGLCETPAGAPREIHSGLCAAEGTHADGEPCAVPRSCASGYCTAGVARVGRCAPLIALGEDCAWAWACDDGWCGGEASLPIQTCEDDALRCTGAADCPGSACVTVAGGVCLPFLAIGDVCRVDYVCASKRCVDGTCAAGLALDAACSSDQECALGTCIESRCRIGEQPVDAPCDMLAVCASHSCIGGRCAPAVCTARIDPSGHGEYRTNPPLWTP